MKQEEKDKIRYWLRERDACCPDEIQMAADSGKPLEDILKNWPEVRHWVWLAWRLNIPDRKLALASVSAANVLRDLITNPRSAAALDAMNIWANGGPEPSWEMLELVYGNHDEAAPDREPAIRTIVWEVLGADLLAGLENIAKGGGV